MQQLLVSLIILSSVGREQSASSVSLLSQAPSSYLAGCVVEQHPEGFPTCKCVSVETDLGPQHPFLGEAITCGMSEQRGEVLSFLGMEQEDDFSVSGSGTFEQQPVLGTGASMAASSGTVQL